MENGASTPVELPTSEETDIQGQGRLSSALGVQYDAGNSTGAGDIGQEAVEDGREAEDVFLPLSPATSPDFSFGPNLTSSNEQPSSAQGRHARRHSRIHSRNLSVFFPRPGQSVTGALGHNEPSNAPQTATIPAAKLQAYDFPGIRSPGSPAVRVESTAPSPLAESQSPQPKGRRGHHHRHSLSHNFFPFLEPTAATPTISPSTSPTTPLSALPKAVPQTVEHYHHRHSDSGSLPANPVQSLRSRYSHLPAPLRLLVAVAFHIPFATQLKLAAALLTVCLGGVLWIIGQSGESLAVTGLGYLAVFDGFGALSRVWIEGHASGVERVWDAWGSIRQGESGLRLPFGARRQVTLSHFAQCIYLLFSAVYVCKESVEHVLLLHGPVEELGIEGAGAHGAAHGTMGHGEGLAASSVALGILDNEPIAVPTRLLCACFILSLFSAMASGNHAGLAAASGPSTFIPPSPKANTLLHWLLSVAANPFVLITLIFSGGIAAASVLLPAGQLSSVDKVVALLESAAMFYIAYPAAVSTGTVLLQTAPPIETGQMNALNRGLHEIEAHDKVVFVSPPRIWQVTPQFNRGKTGQHTRSMSIRRSPQSSLDTQASVVVANLVVHVRSDATDSDVLEVTRFSREKCAPALRWASSASKDISQRQRSIDAGAGGELTVKVVRGTGAHGV